MSVITIKNGTVVDGTGAERRLSDVRVEGGKITRIAPNLPAEGTVIDAAGLIVSPGFIDGHTHSDGSIFGGTDSYNHLEQGTTTQIAGQCGTSPAPGYAGGVDDIGVTGEERNTIAEACRKPSDLMAYGNTVNLGCNMAFYVGHGALRGHAMGFSDAKPTEAEMADMKAMLVDAMEAGYLGFSSGLVYAPSVYGDTDELGELATAMAPYGGVYTSHIRGEGDTVEQAVAEAIAVAEKGGVSLVISHLKVCQAKNAGKSAVILKMLEDLNARGIRAHADQYPFPAGSAPLNAQIPPQFIIGGIGALLERLRSPEQRALMEKAIFEDHETFESSIYAAGWEGVLIAGSPKKPEYVGKRVSEIAAELGKTPMDAYADLLLENEGAGQGIYFSQVESDMMAIMAHPLITTGSDWSDIAPRQDPEREAGGHPRGLGTMTRKLELCREQGIRTLEDCIRSMTGLTAHSVGLANQGILAEGRDANITIFDWDNVRCHADFLHPFRRNDGIHWVLVNGQIAVKDGKTTGVHAGRMLRRGE